MTYINPQFNWVYVRLDFACAKIAIFALFRDTSLALAKTHAVFFMIYILSIETVYSHCFGFTLFAKSVLYVKVAFCYWFWIGWTKTKRAPKARVENLYPGTFFAVATPLCASKSALLNPADRVRALDQTPIRCESRPHRDYVHVVQLYIMNQYVVKKQHIILTRA